MKTTTRLSISIIVVAGLVGASIAGFVTGTRPKLGLDLIGGVSVVLEAPPGTPKDVMEKALENIRSRVDSQGVRESTVSLIGDTNIQVEVPGATKGTITQKNGKFCAKTSTGKDLGCDFATRSEASSAIESEGQQTLLALIGRTGRLEEREVTGTLTPGTPSYATTTVTACPLSLASDPRCEDPKFVQCPFSQSQTPACTTEALKDKPVVFLGSDGQTKYQMGPVEVTGDAISKATGQPPDSQHPGWWVSFRLTGPGSATFEEVTTRLMGKQLAIILDREVASAPTIQGVITGSGEITGSFSETEAKDLATLLNFGALPVELKRLNVETVSPTLGKKSLHQGLLAGLFGLILLMLYLAFYYRLLGVVTWIGMAIWAILALGLISGLGIAIGYSLSLAGIAGIIVSMGITADSYIVFYERLKDEVRHGKTLRAAVQPAFKRAWRTIVAADIVTVLAAAVLYFLAIGSVRGFALTLGLATALDMFVVYFFKRPTVFLIARSPKITDMRGFGLRSGVAADPLPAPVPVTGGSE